MAKPPPRIAVAHLDAGVVGVVGADALVAQHDRGLGQVVLVHDVDRAREVGDLGIRRQRRGGLLPAGEGRLDALAIMSGVSKSPITTRYMRSGWK